MSEGRDWIFLRGLVRGRGHWGDFPDRFRRKFPQDRLELLDLPGNGERRAELSPWSIPDYVPLIRERSEALKAGRPVHLLALSLGGMIAVDWLRQSPQDLSKVFLVCTSAGNLSPFYERFRPANFWRILPALKRPSATEFENMMMKLLVNSRERREAVLPELIRYSEKYPIREVNFLRQIRAAGRFRFPLNKPGNVELIGSYGDSLVSPACTLRIGQTWGVSARMHPWAGHDVAIDDPEWLLEQML